MQDITQYINAQMPTKQAVQDVADHASGVARTRTVCRLRHSDLTPFYLPNPPDPNDPTSLSDFVISTAMSMNTAQDVHYDCDIAFLELPQLGQFNTLRDLIQVYYQYVAPDGTVLMDVPVGIFRFILPDRELHDAGNVWQIKGWDPTYDLAQLWFMDTYVVPPDYPITAAVKQILMADVLPPSQGGRQPTLDGSGHWLGWPDANRPALTPAGCEDVGPNVPASRIQIVDSAIASDIPIPFTRKTNKLAAVNQLLQSINYQPLWCDEHGNFRSAPMPYYNDFTPTTDYTFVTGEMTGLHPGAATLIDPVTVKLGDQSQLANVIHVICENNGKLPLSSVAYNLNLNSAISVPNLGRAIMKLIQDDKIANQDVCDLRAAIELQNASMLTEGVEWTTPIYPWFQAHDYVALNIYNRQGTLEVDSTVNPFAVSVWSLDFGTMQMRWTAGRAVAT